MSFGYFMLGGGSRAYDPDAAIHFGRLTDTDLALQNDLNNLIIALKEAGVWSLLDDFSVIHKNSADSLLGIKGFQDAVLVSTPTFSSAAGFNCTGSRCVNSQLNKNVASAVMADDDMSAFQFRTAESAANVGALGLLGALSAGNTNYMSIQVFDANNSDAVIGHSTVSVAIAASGGGVGFHGCSRTNVNAVELRANAVNNTASQASNTGAPVLDCYAGALNNNGSILLNAGNHDISGWGFGAGLTTTELSDLRTAIQTYMTARGL